MSLSNRGNLWRDPALRELIEPGDASELPFEIYLHLSGIDYDKDMIDRTFFMFLPIEARPII